MSRDYSAWSVWLAGFNTGVFVILLVSAYRTIPDEPVVLIGSLAVLWTVLSMLVVGHHGGVE